MSENLKEFANGVKDLLVTLFDLYAVDLTKPDARERIDAIKAKHDDKILKLNELGKTVTDELDLDCFFCKRYNKDSELVNKAFTHIDVQGDGFYLPVCKVCIPKVGERMKQLIQGSKGAELND